MTPSDFLAPETKTLSGIKFGHSKPASKKEEGVEGKIEKKEELAEQTQSLILDPPT